MIATTKLRNTLGALFLIMACPPTVMLIWYTLYYLDGSLISLWNLIAEQGFFPTLSAIWGPVFFGSRIAWTILGIFAAIQLTFMRILPGSEFKGPTTPDGNVPVYKANGVLAYVFTLLLWYLGAYTFHWFSPTIIYDNFGELLGALNIFSLVFCLFLVLKGKIAPSSSDTSITGNWIFDYYWGTEPLSTI